MESGYILRDLVLHSVGHPAAAQDIYSINDFITIIIAIFCNCFK